MIVGWFTTRRNVFPAWAGWALIAEGLLNLVGGLVSGGPIFGILVALLGAAALFGYGGWLLQERRAPAR